MKDSHYESYVRYSRTRQSAVPVPTTYTTWQILCSFSSTLVRVVTPCEPLRATKMALVVRKLH